MAKFQWEATTRTGDKRRGAMEANSAGDVEARLRGEGLTVGKIKKEGGIGSFEIKIGTGIGPKDLQIFTRQLATMIDAGLPLVQCLDILSNQTTNKNFGKVL